MVKNLASAEDHGSEDYEALVSVSPKEDLKKHIEEERKLKTKHDQESNHERGEEELDKEAKEIKKLEEEIAQAIAEGEELKAEAAKYEDISDTEIQEKEQRLLRAETLLWVLSQVEEHFVGPEEDKNVMKTANGDLAKILHHVCEAVKGLHTNVLPAMAEVAKISDKIKAYPSVTTAEEESTSARVFHQSA